MPFRIRALPLAFMLLALILLSVMHWRYSRIARAEDSLRAFTYHLRDKQFTEAQQRIETALNLSANNAHYLSNAGLLHERMLQRSFDFESFRNPGLSEAETAHVETAVQFYRRALELNPHDDHAAHNLGWLSWLINRRQEAFTYLQRAITINDGFPLYHISLGVLHEYNGEPDAAYQQYGRVIRISPTIADSQFFVDFSKRSPSEADKIISEALAEFQEQVRLGAGPIVKAKLGKLVLDQQPELAAQVLKEATTELSNLTRPWISLGSLYERQGAFDQAELSYKKSIFIDGGETSVLLRLGNFYDQRQRTQEAISYYRRAVQSWIEQTSVHASRVRRIYLSRSTVRDDVIPMGFNTYTNPVFDIDWTCARLSTLYRQQGNEALAEQYEKLRKEYAR
jgi:tetratricopeptide (TPR) repeat protein